MSTFDPAADVTFGPPPDLTIQVPVHDIPFYVVVLHNLAKFGKATTYGGVENRFVFFNLSNTEQAEKLKKTWVPLRDVERIWLIYRRPDNFERRIIL